MAKLLRLIDHLEEILIATLIAAATIIVFIAVVQRYGISNAVHVMTWAKSHGFDGLASLAKSVFVSLNGLRLTWAQELCIFLVVWMAKFGAAYGVRTGIHVGVDVLLNRLRGGARVATVLFGLLAGALFTGIVGVLGVRLVLHMYGTGQTSQALELPMWIVYLAVPLGSFLMCFRFLEVAWRFRATGELPRHDPAGMPLAPTSSPGDTA